MEKKIAGFTYREVMDKTLWVVKMQGWRDVGTYAEVEHLTQSSDCRDVDILCLDRQPVELKPFFDAMETIQKDHGWMTFPDMFDRFGQ